MSHGFIRRMQVMMDEPDSFIIASDERHTENTPCCIEGLALSPELLTRAIVLARRSVRICRVHVLQSFNAYPVSSSFIRVKARLHHMVGSLGFFSIASVYSRAAAGKSWAY